MIVLADGLRPDVVSPSLMPALSALADTFTVARNARTVRPSTTVAALASLATGLKPESHGLVEPGLGFLSRLGRLRPLAGELAAVGLPTHVVASRPTPVEQPLVWALSRTAGVGSIAGTGRRAREVAAQAAQARDPGLLFVYLSDCDRAGHAYGWMSPEYLAAAGEIDTAVGALAPLAERALLVVLADHGGGGVVPRDHHHPHPANERIPLVFAGPGVARRHHLTRRLSLLDVPPTLLWWLGLEVPESYEGRVVREAFSPQHRAAVTA